MLLCALGHQLNFLYPSDVLQDREDPNKFVFYEVYESIDAIDYHKSQDHYKGWADFKESGGVVSSVSMKLDGLYMP